MARRSKSGYLYLQLPDLSSANCPYTFCYCYYYRMIISTKSSPLDYFLCWPHNMVKMATLPFPSNRLLPAGHHTTHRTVILAGIIVSIFVIILAVTIANSRTSFFGRAATTSSTRISGALSAENSYLFASPISAPADGSSLIRITVILLDDQGLGVASQLVSLKPSEAGVQITPVAPTTDTFGRAIFDLSATSPANYTISAEVSGAPLPQTVSIVFR